MKRVSFKWRDGYVILRDDGGDLIVEGSNSVVRFSIREVSVKGLFQGIREHVEGRRGERKIVYIDFAFPLKGLENPVDIVFSRHVDTYIGSYGISYTAVEGVGFYLTIYPPPGALYENAVVYDDGIAITTLSRRHVYVMEENGIRRVIMV